MGEFDQDLIAGLREMARRGESVGAMFGEIKARVGSHPGSILTIMGYMRSAFCLDLIEAKPVAALSRTDKREVTDEALLEELVMPKINKHRSEWDI
jgi:hypothetical protein